MIEINKNPSKQDLRWFGLILAAVLGIVGFVIRGEHPEGAVVLWKVAIGACAVYYIVPPVRRMMFVGFMYLMFPVGFVMSFVIMAAIYYLVFFPIGMMMKVVGYDPMKKKCDPSAATYWEQRPPAATTGSYFRQF